MKKYSITILSLLFSILSEAQVLSKDNFKRYIDKFNENDNELYQFGEFPNSKAWDFLAENIPFFDCPDKQLEETYYFRWWTYRKHIRKTPDCYIITEFLPDVSWAGVYNSICCPAAHHFMEGRWLRDPQYLRDYARFWFNGKSSPRSYSFWAADAIYNFSKVHPNDSLLIELFPSLDNNYISWEKERFDGNEMFWQYDNRDGMEVSISGSYAKPNGHGYRVTINSYMYAEAKVLEKLAQKVGNKVKEQEYKKKAEHIKNVINNRLWDSNAEFYKVIPRGRDMNFSDVREQHGYTPWYFNIPLDNHSVAWKFLMDSKYFFAPYGVTTAEQSHPLFTISYEGHECRWDGPVWPYSTSITLTAMANLLNNYEQEYVSKSDYWILLSQYSRSHRIVLEDGRSLPWIDENINPYTGDWISRTRLKFYENEVWPSNKGGEERGKDYNHSTFNDLIISGLIGIRPSESNELLINPLVPDNSWEYYCLDSLYYKGRTITVCYDKTGTRYNKGKGYFIYIDGNKVHHSLAPQKISFQL